MAKKVILDAGHGGWDNGAMYGSRVEKDDTLQLTLATGEKLKDKGVDVLYTRTSDVYQSPNQKAKIANESGADYFVSIHRNASPMVNQYSGVQTLVYADQGEPKKLAEAINNQLAEVGYRNLGISVRPNLAVLKGTDMPAVLVEAGFINTDVDNQIFEEQFDEIAAAIADGIVEGIGAVAMPVQYRIQVGLFRKYDNALRLQNELAEMGYTVEIVPFGEYYAVLLGKFASFDRAKRVEKVLQEDGYDTWIVGL
ncbi:MAG: N-acetylmuramoyl-L-alanine amidase [Lachnospiraceae bacterium]|nr:N-acetylmuramoyl-L-alanine amidase [Lachnospiraceae bacterium]